MNIKKTYNHLRIIFSYHFGFYFTNIRKHHRLEQYKKEYEMLKKDPLVW